MTKKEKELALIMREGKTYLATLNGRLIK